MIRFIRVFINVFVSLGCFLFLFQQTPAIITFLRWNELQRDLIFVYLVLHLGTTFIQSLRWRTILGQGVSLKDLFFISWASQFVGFFSLGGIGADVYKVVTIDAKGIIGLERVVKSCFLERLWSIAGLVFLFFLCWLWDQGFWLFSAIFCLFVFVVIPFRRIALLSVLTHLFKMLFLLMGLKISYDLSSSSSRWCLVLLAEVIPFSLDGFGVGQLTADYLLFHEAVEIYTLFFTGKMIFKAIGGVFWLKQIGDWRWLGLRKVEAKNNI